MKAPIPADEAQRLAALHRYGILDAPRDPDLEAITRLATHIAGCDVAVINLIDSDRQVQAAATGMEPGVFTRDEAMCAHVVATNEQIHVADASLDERFADNPFVTGAIADVRTYASSPLRTPEGHAVGSLCVVDSASKELDEGTLVALQDLARQVIQLFELRRHVDELGSALAQVDHLAGHDPLTGLANRRRFLETVDEHLAHGSGAPLVAYCDLDGFKPINDTYGHDVGDVVLVTVAERLDRVVRRGDLVARIGGDEFAVLCVSLQEKAVTVLVDRLRAEVEQPIALPGGGEVTVGLSVGVARDRGTGQVEVLMRDADEAMYDDKQVRKGAESRGRRSPGRGGGRRDEDPPDTDDPDTARHA